MNEITPEKVRGFLLTRYSEAITGIGLDPTEVPDSFDFLLTGVIDSFGILEMISSVEDDFRIQRDMAALDAEEVHVFGAACSDRARWCFSIVTPKALS